MAEKPVSTEHTAREGGRVSRETPSAEPADTSPRAPLSPLVPRRPKRGAPTEETMAALAAELRDAVRRLDEIDRPISYEVVEGDEENEAF